MSEERKTLIAELKDTLSRERMWLIACGIITAVASFLRFYQLELRPFHHDEGVNGWFLTNLIRHGTYAYDPANYHGPTLYYITLAFTQVFGVETSVTRASVAVFGVLTVILIFYLRPYIGTYGSLIAAGMVALSPGMVFISRYFIHEIFFVMLSLTLVMSLLMFIDRKRAGIGAIFWISLILAVCFVPSALNLAAFLGDDKGTAALWALRIGFLLVDAVLIFFVVRLLVNWNSGRPIYFLLAAASLALSFATKETGFIAFGTMLIALACIVIWQKIRGTAAVSDTLSIEPITFAGFRSAFGTAADKWLLIAAAALLFTYIVVLFFSSFFTYFDGVGKAFEAYAIWTKTGSKDHTGNGRWAYFTWGWAVEAPIFILSAVGTAVAFYLAKHRFAMFAGLWAVGLLAAYTIIPYKTPWLALSFLLPMCIVGGYGVGQMMTARRSEWRALGVAALLAAAAVLGYQTYEQNFVQYDDNSRPYIYAHTRREFLSMMERIGHYGIKSGKGNDIGVAVMSPDYWPMTWYTRDMPKVVYYSTINDSPTEEMIIVKKKDQDTAAITKFSAQYRYVGTYPLRPGVDLVLLVKADLADPDTKEVYKLAEK